MKIGIKHPKRGLIVLAWISGLVCLGWGYGAALFELVPCENVFRFDQPMACAAPLYLIYGGFAVLIAAAVLTVTAWAKSL